MSDEVYTIKETLAHYFDEMKSDIKEIKEQTQKTNGRVTSLESDRSKVWGAIGMLTILGGVIITLSIMAIDSKIKNAIDTAFNERIQEIEYAK